MAKLDSGRMSDATRVKQVDDAHRQFETDLEAIFGIPDNTDIANPILGSNPETPGAPPVNSDGSITGVPIFRAAAPLSGGANGIGFEFDDGTTRKRLVLEGTSIKIFVFDDDTDTWTQVTDLDNPGSGSGLFTALSDVNLDPLSVADAGKILKVNEDGDGFELVAPGEVDGVTEFTDLDDVNIASPLTAADNGKVVQVGLTGFLELADAPAGIGDPWVMLLQVLGTSGWGTKASTQNNPASKPQHPNANEGWLNTWNWYYPVAGDGIVSDGNLLVDTIIGGTPYLKYYISIPAAGIYRCSMWYNAPNLGVTGIREWRVAPVTATCLSTGATLTDVHTPEYAIVGGTPTGVSGTQFLGAKDLIVTSPGTITLQVRNDSPNAVTGVVFYASITKVK